MIKGFGIDDEAAIIKALEENNGDFAAAMEALAGQLDYGDEDDQKQ